MKAMLLACFFAASSICGAEAKTVSPATLARAACLETISDYASFVTENAAKQPSVPVARWDEAYGRRYGQASSAMTAYFRYWRKQVFNRKVRAHLGELTDASKPDLLKRGYMKVIGKYLSDKDYFAAENFLTAAEAWRLDGEIGEKIRRIRLEHDDALLFFKAATYPNRFTTGALDKYRRENSLAPYTQAEKEFGDPAGTVQRGSRK